MAFSKQKSKEELKNQLNAIQKELDNFKEEPELEVGKWYTNGGKIIINYQGGRSGYGINYNGNWEDAKDWTFKSNLKDWNLSTDEEIKEALIKEAKKRGFKKGVKIDQSSMNTDFETKKYRLDEGYTDYCDGLNTLSFGAYWVFKDGVWAEIVEDNKKPVINGYEMELNGSDIKFGCAKFYTGQIKDSLSFVNLFNADIFRAFSNRKIKSITLDSGAEIKIEELQSIIDYINKL